MGVERIILMLGGEASSAERPDAFFIYSGPEAFEQAMTLRREMMAGGVTTDIDYEQRSMKAQFRSANSSGARFAVVIAESEVSAAAATVKDMVEGEQVTLGRTEALEHIVNALSV